MWGAQLPWRAAGAEVEERRAEDGELVMAGRKSRAARARQGLKSGEHRKDLAKAASASMAWR